MAGLSFQVENQDLGCIAAEKLQSRLVADSSAVSLAKRRSVHGRRPAGEVHPGVAPGSKRQVSALAGTHLRHPDVDVPLDLETLLAPVPGRQQHEQSARLPPVEGLLAIRRREAALVRN